MIETNKVIKECYLIKQDNTINKFSIKLSFFKYKTREIKATETKKLLILIETAARQKWYESFFSFFFLNGMN